MSDCAAPMARITVSGAPYECPAGTKLLDIAKELQPRYPALITLGKLNGRLCELNKTAEDGCAVEFVTIAEMAGAFTYERSLVFLMIKAFRDIAPEYASSIYLDFSVSNGLYCHVKGHTVPERLIGQVAERMRSLVAQDLPFVKSTVRCREAISRFEAQGMYDKAKVFEYRRSSQANFYTLEEYQDYFYTYMVPSTGFLKEFAIFPYAQGFILQPPSRELPCKVRPYVPQPKLFGILQESANWHEKLGLGSVGNLNDLIVRGEANDLILLQEAIMEKQIGDIAEQIAKSGRKFVLIAGPSSSGKTSFSHRLSIQLNALGLRLSPVECDNYFFNRDQYPLDEFGNADYESIDCVDIERLNEDLLALAEGEAVETPIYNFLTGKRESKGKTVKIPKENIIVLEGIHCMNERLTYRIPEERKFRIYISALTSMNLDEHNRIPTSDVRLLRRICRDAATRGYSAQETISRWRSVRAGEEKNIFPYQERADVMMNSALIYEAAVLKPYAEPLLFGVPKDSDEYIEAKRLLKFLDYFLAIPSETVPHNSILREFIGGSLFDV